MWLLTSSGSTTIIIVIVLGAIGICRCPRSCKSKNGEELIVKVETNGKADIENPNSNPVIKNVHSNDCNCSKNDESDIQYEKAINQDSEKMKDNKILRPICQFRR